MLVDANNRTTTYLGGSTEGASYDADGNVVSRSTRAGATIAYGYDTLNRLTSKTPQTGPVVTYTYNRASQLTSVSDNSAAIAPIAAPPSPIQYAASYSYDALNRPTGVSWSPAPTAAAPTTAASVLFTHAYNADNQRTAETVSDNRWVAYPGATGTTSYTANALNQYTSVGAVTPTYDGNGNLTSDGTYTFGYDLENRLVSASGAGTTASYAFDARGRRKLRTVNGATTVTLTDADNRAVLDYDGSSGAIQRWYAYGLGPNDVLNQINVPAGTRTTLLPDLLGSIVATLDSATATLSPFAYRPYGPSAAAATPFGYTGQQIDAETGLYYYRARHYSPLLGRFVQPDPVGYVAGTNLYAYVGNDPLNLIDPSGLWLESAASMTGSFLLRSVQPLVSFYQQSIVYPFYAGLGWLANSPLSDPGVYMSIGAAGIPEAAVASGIRSLAAWGRAAGAGAEGIAGGAQSAIAARALANQLASESAVSAFTIEGTLSEGALAGSREIIPSSQIGNPQIPSGFSKFTTQTYQSPAGDFQVHFYRNPATGEPYYGLDYKAMFNSGKVGP